MGAIRPRRVALTASVALAITPPAQGHRIVAIGNATADDLRVYEDPNDDTTYFVIAAGDEKDVEIHSGTSIAFYLKAAASGTAILIWQ